MGGGLMQLVAYGAQDIYLTGNPQITFFKVVYRRHTNFSMECIEQTFSGTRNFGSKITATISRNGDLVSGLYVTFDPQLVTGNTATKTIDLYPNIGYGLIQEVDIEIGGQRIDRQFGKWMNVWSDLTTDNPSGNRGGLDETGAFLDTVEFSQANDRYGNGRPTQNQMTTFNVGPSSLANNGLVKARFASVPLEFWFCRNPGLALPLIALQYHEVKINLTIIDALHKILRTEDGVAAGSQFTTEPSVSKLGLWADYIYLDTDERRRFAQVSHEYLIEQVQYQSMGNNTQFNLNFNHPVKELIWCGAPKSDHAAADTAAARDTDANDFTDAGYANTVSWLGPSVPCTIHSAASGAAGRDNRLHAGANSNLKWTLKLNGHERFAPRESGYFTGTQVDNHHTGCSGVMVPEAIHVYSFALKPEEHQPSGTCNFSRIDNAQLALTGGASALSARGGGGIDVYAVNYNVLRIMSGMGGLAYSN